MRPTSPADHPEGAVVERSGARRRGTLLLLAATALLGLVQLLVVAPWMGEDEPWQVEYASHVAAGYRPWGGEPMRGPPAVEVDDRVHMPLSQLQVRRRFHAIPAERIASVQAELLASMARRHYYERVDWAGVEPARGDFDQVAPTFTATTQPPLYYGLLGGVIAALGADSVEGQMWIGRILSWLLHLGVVLVSLALARCALDDERTALCAAAVVAFLPMSVRQAAVVNNDVLAKLIAALVLLLCARWVVGRARRWEPWLAVGLCGLGLLTKPTAAGAVLVLLVAPFLRSQRVVRRGRTLGILAGLLLVVGAGVSIWLSQNNTVLPRSMVGFRTRLATGLSWDTVVTLGRTLTGSFGWESRFLPDPLVVLLALLAAVGLAAGLARLVRGSSLGSRPVLVLCLVAVLVQLAMVVLRGAARGRYVMPALPAFSVLVVAGLVGACPARARPLAGTGLVLGLIALEALFLWGGLAFHEYLLWGV